MPRRSGDARRVAGRRARARSVRRRRCPTTGTDAGAAAARRHRRCCSTTRCSTATRASSATSRRARRRSAMLGDFLAAAVNQNVGAWQLAPLATEIEAQTVRWIAELIGFPADARRAAGQRRQHGELRLLPRRARGEGAVGRAQRRAVARCGARCASTRRSETHTWIQKAADLFGLGTDAIRWIADRRRSSGWTPRRCAAQIDAGSPRGDQPFLVVGTAGSVEHRRRRSAAGDRRDLPRARRCGFTSTAPTARWRRSVPGAPASLRALARGRFGRGRSAQVAVRAARSRLRARARRRRRCATRSRITRPTTTSTTRW